MNRYPPGRRIICAGTALVLLLAGSAGCGALRQSEGPSYFTLHYQGAVGGRYLDWTVSVPTAYEEGTPAPLILALHFGGTPSSFYGGTFTDLLVKPALYELDAVILAPTCPVTLNWWDEAMAEAVLALIDTVCARFTIDTDRIVVTGFSFGGIGSWYLAGMYPEIFSAAIPVASQVSEAFLDHIDDIPLYVIHSRADDVLPYTEIVDRVKTLQARGVDVTLDLLSGLTHYDTRAYVKPLRRAVPWLRARWSGADGKRR